ncbi:hybrid sensor histidine kinase/response regulator [Siculibacillus lacustris]|nr:hybrid sensor histidine kinase/response regulator [Siculibacillus lacustris]
MRLGIRCWNACEAIARKKGLVALVGVGLVLLASIIAIFGMLYERQNSVAVSIREDALWATYQTDREAGKLTATLADFLDGRPDTSLEEVLRRFDILYSRHEVMEVADFPSKFRSDPALQELTADLATRLHGLLPVFDRMQAEHAVQYVEMVGVLGKVRALRSVTERLLFATSRVQAEIQVDERSELSRMFAGLALSVGALTLAMGAVIWLIWRQLRQGEVSRQHLQTLSEELARSAEAARAGNTAKSAFLATMSHEIRTPLNGIIGMADLMATERLDPEQREQLDTIRRCSDALISLINDILDFSKLESGAIDLERRTMVLGDVVDDVVDILTPRVEGKDLALVASYPLGSYETDPTRLRQVLINLVGNAVKFTDGGAVVIRVSELRARRRVTGLRFEVEDTGIGIAEETMGRLFSEFTQADATISRRFGGSGLGLVISKRLVVALGGQIGVDSRPDVGTTFWFEIPVEAVGERDEPPPIGDLTVRVGGSRRLVSELVARDLASLGPVLDPVLRASREPDLTIWDVASFEAAAAAGEPIDPSRTVVHGFGARRLSGIVAGVIEGAVTTRRLARMLARRAGSESFEAAPPPADDGRTAVALRHRGHVLVAEDNAVNRRVVAGMLSRLGFTSEIAVDGSQAVDRLTRPGIDIVLMDMQMPVMDGLEATARIRRGSGLSAVVPIIGLTANAFASDRNACFAAGMNDFVVKPVTRHRLEAALMPFALDLPLPAPSSRTSEPRSDMSEAAAASIRVDDAPLLDVRHRRHLTEELGADTLDELTAVFWEDATTLFAAIGAAWAADDLAEMRRQALTLKGAAANVGFSGLVAAAMDLRRVAAFDRPDLMIRLSAVLMKTRLAVAGTRAPAAEAASAPEAPVSLQA